MECRTCTKNAVKCFLSTKRFCSHSCFFLYLLIIDQRSSKTCHCGVCCKFAFWHLRPSRFQLICHSQRTTAQCKIYCVRKETPPKRHKVESHATLARALLPIPPFTLLTHRRYGLKQSFKKSLGGGVLMKEAVKL